MLVDKKRNNSPTKVESYLGKILIALGLVISIIFLVWLLNPDFVGNKPLYWVIIAVFVYKILIRVAEWALCFHLSVTPKPKVTKQWKVDVLTTFCKGEPKEMLIETLQAIQKIEYPHQTFLCDEANDEELKKICKELNITHVTRTLKVNAKAGNINNALNTVANGDICLILDPDHIPDPGILEEVLPYFEDDEVGFVQIAQVYYNQQSTVIAKAAAQQTYQFYGPFMMGLNTYGAVPAIGANCTFRRKALDTIGGHAPGLTEDMHTAMLLHAKKWKSVYNPVVVAKGLVPWNYSGYCLQQLKWSRGSFDLLFNVIPRIFRNLTWKQILYYLSAPFFYLSGLIAVFDFLIPIISLFTGIIPIKISLASFLALYLPLFLISFTIRQYFQRWLLDKHESGASILGGTLFKASWWASLTGLFYALINKKVPYIPTPKDNSHETPLKLLIPNFVVIGTSIIAIVYGLLRDFNPFILFMAFLAFINIAILSVGSVMAMQHLILKVHKIFKGTFISKGSKTRTFIYNIKHKSFRLIQLSTIPFLILIISIIVVFYKYNDKKIEVLKSETANSKHFYIPNLNGSHISNIKPNNDFIYDTFKIDNAFLFKAKAFSDSCSLKKKMAFYIVKLNRKQINDFQLDYTDSIFTDLFSYLKIKYEPVLFSIITDKSLQDSLAPSLAMSLNKLTTIANKVSFPNISWVWHSNKPFNDSSVMINKYFISWILTPFDSENIDKNKNRNNVQGKPILVYKNNSIYSYHPTKEIHETINLDIFKNENNAIQSPNRFIANFKNKKYIKGVAYNSGHDWRDNNFSIPLTLDKLEKDFELIKTMGANTIRRYSPTVYDKNILKIAKKKGLKVLYGFWFDSKVDFNKDKSKIEKYKKQVLNYVEEHKNDTTIIGWSIGNETWGLLKLHFNEPYLSIVRMQYVLMIAQIAENIRNIDTIHPIFVMEEHSPQLSSAVYAFSKFVPEIDFFGINSYYLHNISNLDSIMTSVVPDKPYLVSEFGPKGYWLHEYNDYIFDSLHFETSSLDKANSIKHQWDNYIYKNREKNIGGIAFCWQDRYECTATWFGITDLMSNKKPSWYALKNCYSADTAYSQIPIPSFRILMPKDYSNPGVETKVTAATRDPKLRKTLFFKWMIYEEKTFKKVFETSYTIGEFECVFKIPKVKSNYRLYLYVSDGNGNVVTESSPILIKWNK